MTIDQTPTAPDYRRGALLFVHRQNRNAQGFNNVMAEADQLGRLTAMVWAIVNLARMMDPTLTTPEGAARLQDIAIEFGRREGVTPENLIDGEDGDRDDDK